MIQNKAVSSFPVTQPPISKSTISPAAKLIELRDIHNRVIYKSENATDLSLALTEAINKNVDLSYADFRRCTLREVETFQPCKLIGADFTGAHLSSVDFTYVNLSGAKFVNADLTNTYFGVSRLVGADFTGAHGRSTIDDVSTGFCQSNLMGANFSGATFPGGMFASSILTKAKFVNADLDKCNFEFQNSTDADYRGAKLRGASLDSSVLTRANFQHADLSGANLNNCTGANFAGAILSKKAR